MKKKSSLRRFLTNIYGYAFCNKLMLLSPVYAIFMQSHGMSEMQLSSLFMILSMATVCLQIPVTWVTNKLGAKRALALGQLLKAAGFVLWLVWPTYWGFAIGMAMWGIMSAFYNVAFEAMIYDELRARRHHDIYSKVLGMRYNIQAAASALSAFGSLLMFVGYEWITIASLIPLAMSVAFIARIDLRKAKTNLRPKRKMRFTTVFRTGARICTRTPCIFLMMLLSLLVANVAYLDDYLSPIALEIGMPVEFVGIVSFFILACSILGQTFAYRFNKVPDWLLYATICVAGAAYAVFGGVYSVNGLWILGLAYVLFSAINILLYSRFQDFVPTSYRSVILSLYSIGDNAIYVGTCFVIGLGGEVWGSWRYSVAILGVTTFLIGMWALLFVRDKCSIAQVPNVRRIKTMRPTGDDIV